MTAGTSLAEHAARLAARAPEVALYLDFDGTLSPIVDDPQAARPQPPTIPPASGSPNKLATCWLALAIRLRRGSS